jgi:hypothetical protein
MDKYDVPHLSGIGTQRFVTPYWGPQALTAFNPEVVAVFGEHLRYVDITAGGGGMVFNRAQLGQPSHGNDRNPYSAAGFRAVETLFPIVAEHKALWKAFAAEWHPDNIRHVSDGYVSTNLLSPEQFSTTGRAPNCRSDVAEYIDSLCTHSPLAAFCASRVMLNLFTFRQISWDRKTSDVPSRPCTDVTVKEFWEKTMRQLFRLMSGVLSLRAPVTGSNLDATEAARTVVRSGDVVYTDPAWPWGTEELASTTKDSGNPYEFLTCMMGSIITQRDIPKESIPFWHNKAPERIFADVLSWIRNSFESGACTFVLSTQGTNFPLPRELYHEVSKTLDVPIEIHTKVSGLSGRAANGKTFTEWFGIIRNR